MTTTEIHRQRLFWAARIGVAVSAARLVAITAVMDPLKDSFGLNNADVGWIGGAGFWGFPITMLVFGSLCDVFGMKLVLRLAVLTYLAGTTVMLLANGFASLFLGSLLMSMGDGLVQSAGNPLVVTLFPDRKTEMINKCHLAFAAGMVLFGLTVFSMDRGPWQVQWQVKVALVFLPTVIFGGFFAGQGFPATERVQMGVSFGQMFRETFFRPVFLLLALCMMMTASVELATGTWLTPVYESAKIPGILVLVWVYLLTAVLRQMSGPMVRRFSPPGILLCSAVVSGLGLIALSYAHSLLAALGAGTVFAAGVAYFWPTMIGITSERVPKGGAVALAVIGSVGCAAVGLIATPMMGWVADRYVHHNLPAKEAAVCLRQIAAEYSNPSFVGQFKGRRQDDVRDAVKAAQAALATEAHERKLPEPQTTAALRAAIQAAPKSAAAEAAKALIRPAESAGGQVAFRWAALMSAALTVIFAGLYVSDRLRGG